MKKRKKPGLAEELAGMARAQERDADLARANRHLKKRLDKLTDGLSAFERITRECVKGLPAIVVRQPRRSTGKGAAELMVAMLSDMQIGSKIGRAETSGLGGWDRSAFEKALDRWVERLLCILEVQRSDHPVDRLCIPALGDFVEGEDIFRGQAWHLDMDLVDQIVWGGRRTAIALRTLAEEGRFRYGVDIWGVPGNHGRLGRPGQIRANADDLFLLFLAAELRDIESIRVHHSASPLMMVQVFSKWNLLMTHGHETRSWMGIPYYGLERDGLKQMAMTRVVFHYKLCGHHHRPAEMDLGPDLTVMVNGSWPGPTDFSVNTLASACTPKQWAFFMHPERGRTALYDIRLGDIPALTPSKGGIFTPVREA